MSLSSSVTSIFPRISTLKLETPLDRLKTVLFLDDQTLWENPVKIRLVSSREIRLNFFI
jgi:hypothetical protein